MPESHDQRRSWWARHRADALVALTVLVVAGPIVQSRQAHQASRLAFTAALVEDRSIVIDRFEPILDVDFAVRDGVLYSDKGPGQPFLAVPFYALYRAAGGESAATAPALGNYGLWWVSLWTATVPAAVLAVLMRRAALLVLGAGRRRSVDDRRRYAGAVAEAAATDDRRRRAGERAATVGALAIAMGTLLAPFSSVLFGHALSGVLGFSAYLLARGRDASLWRLSAAGLCAGGAVLVEYTSGFVVLAVAVLVLVRHGERLVTERGWTRVLAFCAGGVPAVVALAAYNTAAFGGPLEFSYQSSRFFGEVHATGFFGAQLPDLRGYAEVLGWERGLLVLTPVVGAALAGSWQIARGREGREVADLGIVALAVFALYVSLQAGWPNPTGGASPGPRYVVPALPFLAPGAAYAWQRRPRLVTALALFGAATMLLGTWTNPLAQPTEVSALGHWIWRVGHDRLARTVLTPWLGEWSLLVPLSLGAGVATAAVLASRGGYSSAATASASRSTAPDAVAMNSDGSTSSTSRTTGPRPGSSSRSTRA